VAHSLPLSIPSAKDPWGNLILYQPDTFFTATSKDATVNNRVDSGVFSGSDSKLYRLVSAGEDMLFNNTEGLPNTTTDSLNLDKYCARDDICIEIPTSKLVSKLAQTGSGVD
jgi:hypothetical protein